MSIGVSTSRKPRSCSTLPHAERDLVAQHEVLQHRRAAQVEVAVLEAQLLGRVGAVLDDEGRRLGARQERRGASRRPRSLRSAAPCCAGPRPRRTTSPSISTTSSLRASTRPSTASARAARAVEDDLRRGRCGRGPSGRSARRDPAGGRPSPGGARPCPASVARSSPAGWRGRARHRSLAAPSRSASSRRAETSAALRVVRSLIVTFPSSRSRDPRSTARTPAARKRVAARVRERSAPRARGPCRSRGRDSRVSTIASGSERRGSRRPRRARRRAPPSSPGTTQKHRPRRPDVAPSSTATSRSSPIAKPTAGVGGPPSCADEAVVAAAAEDRVLRAEPLRGDLEHRARVVVEAAHDRGALGEAHAGLARAAP